MIPLMLASLAGGLATFLCLLPYGALPAILCAPLGGSLATTLAGFLVMRLNANDRIDAATPLPADDGLDAAMDAHADAMVAALRGIAARATPVVPVAAIHSEAARRAG